MKCTRLHLNIIIFWGETLLCNTAPMMVFTLSSTEYARLYLGGYLEIKPADRIYFTLFAVLLKVLFIVQSSTQDRLHLVHFYRFESRQCRRR